MLTTLVLTDAGFRAIGQEPPATATDADTAPPTASDAAVAQEAAAIADALDAATLAPTPRANLRTAAAAVLAAWDDQGNRDTDIIAALEAPMDVLRALVAEKAPRDTGTTRKPREGTKQEAVLTLLRRTEGATIAQITETTGWQQHTVRGFLAGLKKKGIKIDTLEKVRMVGPNRDVEGVLQQVSHQPMKPYAAIVAAMASLTAAMSTNTLDKYCKRNKLHCGAGAQGESLATPNWISGSTAAGGNSKAAASEREFPSTDTAAPYRALPAPAATSPR
jgi:hypothetical protein